MPLCLHAARLTISRARPRYPSPMARFPMVMLVRRVSMGYTASAAAAPDRHPAATRCQLLRETSPLEALARASGSIRSLLTVSYT